MIKYILPAVLSICFLNLAHAEKKDESYQVVEFQGVVQSFDKKTVTLENAGRKQKFDRSAFPQKTLKAGQIVTAYYKYKQSDVKGQ